MGKMKTRLMEIQDGAFYWIDKALNDEITAEEAEDKFLRRYPGNERIFYDCIEEKLGE